MAAINAAYRKTDSAGVSPKEKLKAINQAYSLLDSTVSSKTKRKVLSRKIKLHKKRREKSDAIRFAYEYLNHCKLTNDTILIAKANFKLGSVYDYFILRDSAFFYYNEAKNLYVQSKRYVRAGENCLNMAIILEKAGDYKGCEEIAVEGLGYLENDFFKLQNVITDKTDKKRRFALAGLENCIAISTRRRNILDDALIYCDRAIRHTPEAKNKLVYYNTKANVYLDKNEYDNAIEYYSKVISAYDSIKTIGKIKLKVKALGNLAFTNWKKTGSPEYLDEIMNTLKLKDSLRDFDGIVITYGHLSEFFEESNPEISRDYAIKMYNSARNLKRIEDALEALTKLIRLEKKSTDKLDYFDKYIALDDSLKKARANSSNKFAKIRYESKKRLRQLAELRASNAEKELSLERTKRQRTLATTVIIALLLVSFVVYKNITIKHNEEKIAQIYQTETNISKKIHDEIANDVYNTMTKLQSQDFEKADVILDDLDHIYVRAREISREHGSIDFEDDFENILHDLFLNFKSDQVSIITRGLNKMSWGGINPFKRATIYRVIQELLVNMKKHSNASMVIVSFKIIKKKMVITYSDNGVGCDLKKKSGLLNVENRIRSFNGTINFRSEINNGFKAVIEV